MIKRQDNLFVATLTIKIINGTKAESVKLNQLSVDAFKRFENEIREVRKSYGCNTVDTYTMSSKNWTIKRVDGGCAWDGFYFLKKVLFGKIE